MIPMGSGRGVRGTICLTVPKCSILKRKKQSKTSPPSRFSTHLPVLEGRNQPVLKIDMTEESGCAAVEGEHAEMRGRWQLVAWISASQTGPMAILRSPCPARSCWSGQTCPAQQWVVEAMQKGATTSQGEAHR